MVSLYGLESLGFRVKNLYIALGSVFWFPTFVSLSFGGSP